jgi:hypothetical protein
MIRFACIFVAVGLASAGSTALAAKPQPALMTEAQMDDVTAGALGDGLLTIVFQDSFNNLTVDFGGSAGVPGNGASKGFTNGKGNPHQIGNAGNGASPIKPNSTFLFQVNIAANVNAAIAGGDATAGQSVGTQTITTTVSTPTQTLTATKK